MTQRGNLDHAISPPALEEAPQAEEGLEGVVGDDKLLELIRLPVPHEPGPRHLDDVDVGGADHEGRPDGGHEGQGVGPGVPRLLHHLDILPVHPAHTQSDLQTNNSNKTQPADDCFRHEKCHARINLTEEKYWRALRKTVTM